ncbi:hypothetical protein PENSUB_13972, partial [Penicillium subrubescens]
LTYTRVDYLCDLGEVATARLDKEPGRLSEFLGRHGRRPNAVGRVGDAKQHTALPNGSPAPGERVAADAVERYITLRRGRVLGSLIGDRLLSVVDNICSAGLVHVVNLGGPRHSDDSACACCGGELHGLAADAAARRCDKYPYLTVGFTNLSVAALSNDSPWVEQAVLKEPLIGG